ncbi:MAG TPA: hypothetical protein PLZ52_12405 [Bacteroidales bacterium]|nr:hypothetical protein [Bacteroidales bacterium]
MDSFALNCIIGVAAIVLLVWAAVVINRIINRKKLKDTMERLAKTYQAQVDEFDYTGNFIIAIDKRQALVFFQKRKSENETKEVVDLKGFVKCEMMAFTRPAANGSIIHDSIILTFIPPDKQARTTKLELYNSDTDALDINDELVLGKKWEKLANEIIKSLRR